jgi:hypothetical protein
MTLTSPRPRFWLRDLIAVGGPIAFFAAWVIGAAAQPRFSFITDDESSIAAIGAAHPWITMTGDTLLGLAMLGLAASVSATLAGRRRTLVVVSLCVAGAATTVQALVREDCIKALGLCAAAGRSAGQTWRQPVHDTASVIAFLAVFLAAFLLARPLNQGGPASELAAYSKWTGIVGVVLVFVYGAVSDSSVAGISELVLILVPLSWMVALGRRLAVERPSVLAGVGVETSIKRGG